MFSARKSALSLVAGAFAALVATHAGAATYKVYDQFNVSGGAITAADFAFGYLPGSETFAGTLTAFTRFDTACAGNPNFQCAATFSGDTTPGVYKAPGAYATGTVVFEPGELNLHTGPGGESAGVQFIAPTAGSYRFKGGFSLNDHSPTGVSLAAFVGTASQFSTSLGGGLGASHLIDFTADLDAGERVTFLVGPGQSYSNDSTGLTLAVTTGVPEPSAWAMMIMGFGGAGALLRGRRGRRLAA